MKDFKKLLFLLTPSEKIQAFVLLLMVFLMALLDMIGVASILPFISVLTNPTIIDNNQILNNMFQISKLVGVKNNQEFLIILGIFVFVLLVASLSFKALTTYVQLRFTSMLEFSISKRLIERYLHQSYSWFLNQHSANLGTNILAEVGLIVGGFIKPVLSILTHIMLVITLITLLILVDPKLTLIVGFSISTIYLIIFYLSHKYILRLGKERLRSQQLRYKVVSEVFGAVKEVKTGGLEQSYIERYSSPALIFAKNIASARILSQLPHYFLQIIAFGGIMLMILYLMIQKGNFNDVLPVVTLYVFAGYRMMPALNGIYNSFIAIEFIGPSIDKLNNDMKNLKQFFFNKKKFNFSLKKDITLKNIDFNYPYTTRKVLKKINLKIPAKSIIGLIGSTGSGKTTIVDIILGLLRPQVGVLEVDGKTITKQNVKSWQKIIGYVPQNIFLTDDTIAANIAFGVKPEDIDYEIVKKVSKIANLHKFIEDELPNQYKTIIGERGIKLSGGQRQRIGIARALYQGPKLLVLDEATSALDNDTEKVVMDAVDKLSNKITIILIAHRLNTVQRCDKIYLIEKGEIKNQGNFKELIKINKNFSFLSEIKK